MARFVYRLQKVYELRERKKKEQELRVQEAQARVQEIEGMIEAKKNEIRLLKQSMLTAAPTLMAAHDEFIYGMLGELDRLHEELQMAKDRLTYEKKMLIKAQADLEALVKHKEKAYELWQEEEKQLEMKQLDEIAGQRYFRMQQANLADEAEEALRLEAEEDSEEKPRV